MHKPKSLPRRLAAILAVATLVAIFLLALITQITVVNASSATSTWAWNTYSGTSHWHVTITEDESECGGGTTSDETDISIEHSGTSAVMEDLHGDIESRFVSANILHVPGRIVSDGGGESEISPYDVFFTTDCASFAARYTWDYSDEYQSCSGSTRMAGTNADPGGCPLSPGTCRSGLDCNSTSSCVDGVCVPTQTTGICRSDSDCNAGHTCVDGECVSSHSQPTPTPTPVAIQLVTARQKLNTDLLLWQRLDGLLHELEQAYGSYAPGSYEEGYAKMIKERNPGLIRLAQEEIDAAEADIEAKYKAILETDPNNAQANWDMAELRKSQGNYAEYQAYMDKALGKISDAQAEEVKSSIQSNLGLGTTPTPNNSNVVRQLETETKEIKSVAGIELASLTSQQRNDLMRGLIMISLFDRNGDVLSSLNIQFK